MASTAPAIPYEHWVSHLLAYLFGPCLALGAECGYNTLDKPSQSSTGGVHALTYPLDEACYKWLIKQAKEHYESHTHLKRPYLCDYPAIYKRFGAKGLLKQCEQGTRREYLNFQLWNRILVGTHPSRRYQWYEDDYGKPNKKKGLVS